MTNESSPVMQEKCSRHRARMVATVLTVLGMMSCLISWTLSKAYTAEQLADKVDTQFQVHEAGQMEHNKHLKETLDEIKATLKEMLVIARNGK